MLVTPDFYLKFNLNLSPKLQTYKHSHYLLSSLDIHYLKFFDSPPTSVRSIIILEEACSSYAMSHLVFYSYVFGSTVPLKT